VLIEASLAIVLFDERGGVMAGIWQDPSGGETVTIPFDLDIDPVVPLAKAVPREAGAASRWLETISLV
jgi:hypothetical protein